VRISFSIDHNDLLICDVRTILLISSVLQRSALVMSSTTICVWGLKRCRMAHSNGGR
jgi:hypothetical protein